MPDDDDNDENYKKEKDILNMNRLVIQWTLTPLSHDMTIVIFCFCFRVKLTEYVHDCTVLHPFMKEKKVRLLY